MTGVGYTGWHCSSPYFLAELPLRLPADAAPSCPLISTTLQNGVFIFLYVRSLTLADYTTVVRDANHRRSNRSPPLRLYRGVLGNASGFSRLIIVGAVRVYVIVMRYIATRVDDYAGFAFVL